MQQLQEYCDVTPSSYATINDLLNSGSQFVAVRHLGHWYRGRLLDIRGQVMLIINLNIIKVPST